MFMKTIVHYFDELEEPQEENLRNTEAQPKDPNEQKTYAKMKKQSRL